MRLCLVRHAIAEERGPRYPDDSLRPLTEQGRERMTQAAAGLRMFVKPAAILTSPYVRARETAEILGEAFGVSSLVETEALADGDNHALLAALRQTGAEEAVAVGHEPYISKTLSWLLTGDDQSVSVVFKKGGAALVSSPGLPAPGGCTLEWHMQPAALRALGRSGSG